MIYWFLWVLSCPRLTSFPCPLSSLVLSLSPSPPPEVSFSHHISLITGQLQGLARVAPIPRWPIPPGCFAYVAYQGAQRVTEGRPLPASPTENTGLHCSLVFGLISLEGPCQVIVASHHFATGQFIASVAAGSPRSSVGADPAPQGTFGDVCGMFVVVTTGVWGSSGIECVGLGMLLHTPPCPGWPQCPQHQGEDACGGDQQTL